MNWTSPVKILAVSSAGKNPGPTATCRLTPVPRPTFEHAWCRPQVKCRASVARHKPCASPHERADMPTFLPAGLPQHVFDNYSPSPPCHVPCYRGRCSAPVERLEFKQIITGKSCVEDAASSSLSCTSSLIRPPTHLLGAGDGPPALPRQVLRYWAGSPNQHRQANRLYLLRMCIGAAEREVSHSKSDAHVRVWVR